MKPANISGNKDKKGKKIKLKIVLRDAINLI